MPRRPREEKGLPGGGDLPKPSDAPKDITEAVANARIEALRNRERGITLTKEMIEKEAQLARIAAEALPPQKQRVRLAEIEVRSANQINQLEQQQLKAANSVTKAKLELNKLLTKAKGEQGILNDEQLIQAENQIKVNELMIKFNVLVERVSSLLRNLKKSLKE